MQALKKKKRLEKNLQQIDGTLTTIELQREALEGANTNTAVLESMKNAAQALKQAHKNLYVFVIKFFNFICISEINLLAHFYAMFSCGFHVPKIMFSMCVIPESSKYICLDHLITKVIEMINLP